MDSKPAQLAQGCTFVGALDEFVQRLDEGGQSRSLHRLAGQLHASCGDEAAQEQWVAAIRERFAAIQAVCFEIDLHGRSPRQVISSPRDRYTHEQAIEALASSLQDSARGEAVLLESGGSPHVRVCGAAVRCEPARALGIVLVRPQDAVGSNEAILEYLAALTWHLKCADAAGAKIRALSMRLSPLDLLDILPLPCMITDGAGRAVERNESFSELMGAAHLEIVTGRLRFADPYLQSSWQVALSEVDATAVPQTLLVATHDGGEWCLHLTPLRCALDPGDTTGRQMILAIAEPHLPMAAPQTPAMPEFDRPLTPAETDVLNSMMQGHSAKVIANSRGASVNTVRSQIMSILEKTGFNNQKSLMASLSNSVFGNSTASVFQPSAMRRNPSARR